jgi:hypothetical protein
MSDAGRRRFVIKEHHNIFATDRTPTPLRDYPSLLPASILSQLHGPDDVEPPMLGTLLNDLSDLPFSLQELEENANDAAFQNHLARSTPSLAQSCHSDSVQPQTKVTSKWLTIQCLSPISRPQRKELPPYFHTSSIKPVSDNLPSRHKHWTEEEDAILRHAVAQNGTRDWKELSKKYFQNSRSASQCKTRWKSVSLAIHCVKSTCLMQNDF